MKKYSLNKTKRAFTMAEVLIALTIIGVIAVITIPSLTGKTSSKQFVATYKKSIATIEQALKMASVDGKDASAKIVNGVYAVGQALIDNVGAIKMTNPWTLKASSNSVWSIAPAVPGTTVPGNSVNTTDAQVFMFKDKQAYLIVPAQGGGRCYSAGKPVVSGQTINYLGSYCLAYIDVNGNKGPNQVISCDNQTTVMPATFSLNIQPGDCTLTQESITDVYPVVIYDDKIIPATPAAAAVLQDRY